MQTRLESYCVNDHSQILPYMATPEQGRGLMDIVSYYLPQGPLRQVVTYFRSGGLLPLYVGHSEYYDFDALVSELLQIPGVSTSFRSSMFGGGKGSDLPNMFVSAAAETVERAIGALGFFEKRDALRFATYKEMQSRGLECPGPDELKLFAEEQYADPRFNFEPYRETTPLRWIRGQRLLSGKPTWLPAQIVLPYYRPCEGEVMVGYSTTGGLACHINRKEALLHGILELIERDAVNLHWNCRRKPTVIELDSAPDSPILRKLLAQARHLPIGFTFYLHTTEFTEVPVVTVIGFANNFRKYSYYAGGGVGFDIEEAMHYALSEYGQSEGTLRILLVSPDWDLARSARRIFDIDEHVKTVEIDHFFKIVAYYGYPNNARKLQWYLQDNPKASLSQLHLSPCFTGTDQRYDRMLQVIAAHKIDPVIFDLTPPHMSQLRLIKSYSIELTPPYVQSLPLLGNKRYYEQPQNLGWADRILRFCDLTVDPQPYP